MAQTKKKRRTKHRGNAAGIVETRGRTGRKPTGGRAQGGRQASAREARAGDRFDRPPTWRSAANRALVAAVLFVVVIVIALRPADRPRRSRSAGFMLLLYIPLGYYTDLFIYRRRQAKKLRRAAPALSD